MENEEHAQNEKHVETFEPLIEGDDGKSDSKR